MMGILLICSAFIVKDADVLASGLFQWKHCITIYIETGENVDLGRYSLQCGRRNDALKLWLAL